MGMHNWNKKAHEARPFIFTLCLFIKKLHLCISEHHRQKQTPIPHPAFSICARSSPNPLLAPEFFQSLPPSPKIARRQEPNYQFTSRFLPEKGGIFFFFTFVSEQTINVRAKNHHRSRLQPRHMLSDRAKSRLPSHKLKVQRLGLQKSPWAYQTHRNKRGKKSVCTEYSPRTFCQTDLCSTPADPMMRYIFE